MSSHANTTASSAEDIWKHVVGMAVLRDAKADCPPPHFASNSLLANFAYLLSVTSRQHEHTHANAAIHLSAELLPDIGCMDFRVLTKAAVIQISLGLHDATEIICLGLQKHSFLTAANA